jgi:hypothetical protein
VDSSSRSAARRIEDSFVHRIEATVKKLLPGSGGVRNALCGRSGHPLTPCYVLRVHIPLVAVRNGEVLPIGPPDLNAFAGNLNKRTLAAALGPVTVLRATLATRSREIGDEIWDSNIPLLAHVVREIRGGYAATPFEVDSTIARLELPGPSPGRKHQRRGWFGVLANNIRKGTLAAMNIRRIPRDRGTPKRIIDKIRPFARVDKGIAVQSLWSGTETVVPESWFASEPALNAQGWMIARVQRPEWEYRRPSPGGGFK